MKSIDFKTAVQPNRRKTPVPSYWCFFISQIPGLTVFHNKPLDREPVVKPPRLHRLLKLRAAALVAVDPDAGDAERMGVLPPSDECIDYHFGLSERARVGDGVLMCFRTQMFVTRSEVVVVSGLSSGVPRLEGVFDAQGRRLR